MGITVAIVGVGLIGGSLGLALRDCPLVERVVGVDVDRRVLAEARAMGAVDACASLQEAVASADVVFLCCPMEAVEQLLQAMAPCLRAGAIVSDVGSCKRRVMEAFARCLPPSVQGIGGHPMAGAETTGIAGSDRYLFENAVYVLTPPPGVAAASMERLQSLVAATGARVLVMDADTHDVLVAAVSHLPHLVAAELVRVASRQPEALVLAAGGFRDATRIAASNPGMWEDIIFSNREAVLGQLEAMISSLEEVRDVVAAGDRPALRARLEQARAVRESIPRRQKGLLAQLHEVTAIVPDRPGVIGQVGVVLGRQGVNIVDIEILRVREGDGGTLRLAFATPAEAERAVELLRAEGIKSWVR